MKAVILANKSSEAGGMLPPSACKQTTATHVTCTAPATGITAAVFQTYPSLKALYAAYTAKVSSLNSGQFKQNFGDCSSQATFGEVGWNHLFQHPKTYTVGQMTSGTVKDDQAAGRVFCNNTQGREYMVWTQNAGNMLGYVYGPVQGNVWNWWVPVHHNIGLGTGAQPGWQLSNDSLYATQQVGAAVLGWPDLGGRRSDRRAACHGEDGVLRPDGRHVEPGPGSAGPVASRDDGVVPEHGVGDRWFPAAGQRDHRGRLRPGAAPEPVPDRLG